MTKLRFSDGIEINTGGQLRTLRLTDGLYVVGAGYCIPVKDEAEARKRVAELQKKVDKLPENGLK